MLFFLVGLYLLKPDYILSLADNLFSGENVNGILDGNKSRVRDDKSPFAINTSGASEFMTGFLKEEALKHSPQTSESSDLWDWEKDRFLADVISVNKQNKQLFLNIYWPDNKLFSGRDLAVSVSCEPERTGMISSKNRDYLKENFELFNEVAPRDLLYSFCLNPECTEVGKECVLVKRK